MAKAFQSPDEFREVMEKTFTIMSEDADMGPKLKAAETSQRFEFTDLELVVNLRPGRGEEEGNLIWTWSDEVDWEPRVRMTMSSETANRYFQGKESVPAAFDKGKITTGGDVKAALAILPITTPLFPRYRDLVESDYPHLVV
jgi:hypothetical protein